MEPAPTDPPRSFLAVFVVLGVLLAFGGLLFVANFTGLTSTPLSVQPPASDDPFEAFEANTDRKEKRAQKGKTKVPSEKLWVTGSPIERPAAPEGAKNVVLVVLTAVRRDHLTPYGAPPHLTPYLQDLARSGVRFDDLVAASPFSRTSAVAFLTGHHAATLDMVDPGPGAEERVLRPDVETLAERLRGSGWQTVGLTANFNLNTATGLAQGFDRYRDAQQASFHLSSRTDGNKLVNAALEALRARTEDEQTRPFYLQLDLVDAHSPIRPRRDLESKFDEDLPNAAYRVAVNRVDTFLKQLMDGLEEDDHTTRTDTVLVVIADHGEGIGQPAHHGEQHGRLLYPSSVLVPWLIVGPEIPGGRVIGGIASHTDVMPTVLDLVGLPLPDGIDGRSWAAQVRGNGDRTTREQAFSDTWYFTANRASIWTEATQCQKDFGSKGPPDGFTDACYDRRADPDFTRPKQDPALEAALEAWRAEASRAVTTPPVAPPEEQSG